MPINELRSITTFAKTAELGSLRKAAEVQGISPQAASQALAQLEQHLGVRLFHRTTRNMALTDEGRQFLEAAQPSLLGLQRALHLTRRTKDDIAGPLRIAGPRSTFLPVLAPLLEEFCARHPDAQPDVRLDDRIGNWVEDRVDVGFRVGVSPAEGVIARRMLAVPLVICASPAYLGRHGAPDTLAALLGHRCSGYRHPTTDKVMPWYVKVDGHVVGHDIVPAMCTNDEDLETQTVLSGQAIGLLAGFTAITHIRSGRVVPLLTQHVADDRSLFIYYGSRTSQPSRARAFIDIAVQRLVGNPTYTLGAKELATAEAKGRKAHRPPRS